MTMTHKDFRRWRKALDLSQKDAAEALGLKRRVVQYYEKGERDGELVDIPKAVRLACWALTQGKADYAGPDKETDKPAKAPKTAKPKDGKEKDTKNKAKTEAAADDSAPMEPAAAEPAPAPAPAPASTDATPSEAAPAEDAPDSIAPAPSPVPAAEILAATGKARGKAVTRAPLKPAPAAP